MGLLVDGTIEQLRKALARFADEIEGVKQTKAVQIVITTEVSETCEPVYRVLKNHNPLLQEDDAGGHTPNWTFKQIMNKNLDLFGYEDRAREYLIAALAKLAEVNNIDPTRIEIRVITGDNSNYPRPVPWLYIDKKPVQAPKGQLTFSKDIFQE